MTHNTDNNFLHVSSKLRTRTIVINVSYSEIIRPLLGHRFLEPVFLSFERNFCNQNDFKKTKFQIIAAYLIVSTPPLIVIFRVNCSRGVLLIFSTSICAFVASRIALMLTPARPIILGIAFDIILKT